MHTSQEQCAGITCHSRKVPKVQRTTTLTGPMTTGKTCLQPGSGMSDRESSIVNFCLLKRHPVMINGEACTEATASFTRRRRTSRLRVQQSSWRSLKRRLKNANLKSFRNTELWFHRPTPCLELALERD